MLCAGFLRAAFCSSVPGVRSLLASDALQLDRAIRMLHPLHQTNPILFESYIGLREQ